MLYDSASGLTVSVKVSHSDERPETNKQNWSDIQILIPNEGFVEWSLIQVLTAVNAA